MMPWNLIQKTIKSIKYNTTQMLYPKKFVDLLSSSQENYIGHGNPYAKILLIGQEPASDPNAPAEFDDRNDHIRSIKSNREDWLRNIKDCLGFDDLHICCTPETLDNYNPLFPYKGQKFQVRSVSKKDNTLKGANGTSRTWYNYQKLINRIYSNLCAKRKFMTKDDDIDFHYFSFHTDMSSASSKKHIPKSEDSIKSVSERISLLSNEFFRNFPIVIAAVHNFPRDTYGDDYFGDIFNVEYIGNKGTNLRYWMNVSVRNDDIYPMILIHTLQFSEPLSDQYLDQIAEYIIDFSNGHNIELIPAYPIKLT